MCKQIMSHTLPSAVSILNPFSAGLEAQNKSFYSLFCFCMRELLYDLKRHKSTAIIHVQSQVLTIAEE